MHAFRTRSSLGSRLPRASVVSPPARMCCRIAWGHLHAMGLDRLWGLSKRMRCATSPPGHPEGARSLYRAPLPPIVLDRTLAEHLRSRSLQRVPGSIRPGAAQAASRASSAFAARPPSVAVGPVARAGAVGAGPRASSAGRPGMPPSDHDVCCLVGKSVGRLRG